MKGEQRKVCVMTGATGRLGSSIALSLAQRGYDMFFTWHSSPEAAQETLENIRKYRPDSFMTQCDVSKVASIKNAFSEFRRHFERLDLPLVSASSFYATPVGQVTEKEWDNLVDTNFKGAFFTMQEGASIMQHQPFVSRIVTITDIAAELVWKNFAPYTAAKAATQHLTKVFARVLAPRVLVNSIAPGTFTINPEWNNGQDLQEELKERIPLGTLGSTTDIMGVLDFLTENTYVTGQIINVDGGRLLC
jgi:pteridine reductase